MSHIVIFTKSTPDTAAKVEVDAKGAVTWGNAGLVLNPWDEYSVTEAVLLRDAHKGKATALAIGPEMHSDALKQALAIGIDEAYRVWDDGMEGQDTLGYANAAAAAIRKLNDVKLVIFGKELVDVGTDAHVYQLGRKLGWPVIGAVSKITGIDFAAGTIRVERMVEEGKQTVTSKLPAVISVLKDINDPKSPSFIGIRKAAKATIPVWSSADLGLGDSASGKAAKMRTTGYANLPARAGAVEIIDGANEKEKAEKLIAKLLEEKAL
jgi:electron transfer flavoprotein beta subunit